MIATMKSRYFLIGLALCGAAIAQESWIERSNRNAALVFEAMGAFDPEQASYYGLERFDTAVFDLGPRYSERFIAAGGALVKRLAALKAAEKDARVAQD